MGKSFVFFILAIALIETAGKALNDPPVNGLGRIIEKRRALSEDNEALNAPPAGGLHRIIEKRRVLSEDNEDHDRLSRPPKGRIIEKRQILSEDDKALDTPLITGQFRIIAEETAYLRIMNFFMFHHVVYLIESLTGGDLYPNWNKALAIWSTWQDHEEKTLKMLYAKETKLEI